MSEKYQFLLKRDIYTAHPCTKLQVQRGICAGIAHKPDTHARHVHARGSILLASPPFFRLFAGRAVGRNARRELREKFTWLAQTRPEFDSGTYCSSNFTVPAAVLPVDTKKCGCSGCVRRESSQTGLPLLPSLVLSSPLFFILYTPSLPSPVIFLAERSRNSSAANATRWKLMRVELVRAEFDRSADDLLLHLYGTRKYAENRAPHIGAGPSVTVALCVH